MGKKNAPPASTTARGGRSSKRTRGSSKGAARRGRGQHEYKSAASDDRRPESCVDQLESSLERGEDGDDDDIEKEEGEQVVLNELVQMVNVGWVPTPIKNW